MLSKWRKQSKFVCQWVLRTSVYIHKVVKFQILLLKYHLPPWVGPGAKLEVALLVIKGKPGDVYLAGWFENTRGDEQTTTITGNYYICLERAVKLLICAENWICNRDFHLKHFYSQYFVFLLYCIWINKPMWISLSLKQVTLVPLTLKKVSIRVFLTNIEVFFLCKNSSMIDTISSYETTKTVHIRITIKIKTGRVAQQC